MPGAAPAAVRALLDRVGDLAAAVVAGDLTPSERAARTRVAADTAGHLATVGPWLNPYRRGAGYSLTVDTARAAHGDEAAADRLACWRMARELAEHGGPARAVGRAAQMVDVSGLYPQGAVAGPAPLPTYSALLDGLAAQEYMFPGATFGTAGEWSGLDTLGMLDPVLPLTGTNAVHTGLEQVPGHCGVAILNISRQVRDLTRPSGQIDAVMLAAANRALEGGLVADLIAAGTATPAGADLSATLDAAVAASSVAADGPADTILTALNARPYVLRAYTGHPAPPLIVPVAAVPAGKAIVIALDAPGGTEFLADEPHWHAKLEPGIVGESVAVERWAAVNTRGPAGAVQIVTLP